MYNQHFGFLKSPFSITPDPRFFYATPVYLEAYATLRYGIESRKGFIAITGEVGTGKTTLLRKLMREFESTIHFALIFNTDLTYNELLRVVLRDLGLASQTNDRLAMVDELNAYLLEQLKRRQIVCLLIDEVQNLSDESLEGLRLLSNLETDNEKLLQIVLMGQPELRDKLDKPSLRQLKQRIAIQCEIPPLKDKEVGSYINFRLDIAGYKGKELFPPDTVQEIAHYSKGIPRLINIICDNALLITFAASQRFVSLGTIKEVAGDLRLGSKGQNDDAENPLPAPPSKPKQATYVREAPSRVSRRTLRRGVKAGVGTFSVILVSLAVFISDPQLVFTSALKTLADFKHNSQQWILLVTRPEVIPPKPAVEGQHLQPKNAGVDPKRTEQRVTIRYGSTIYTIASDAYGANAVLGMDLIKELNPEIQNLNWVFAGQDILLPILTRETLLRQQPDGSYRLIIGSFLSEKEANETAGRIIKAGYQILITPKRVSNNLTLHRLEIDGLKTLREATQTFEAGVKNEWITFPVTTGTGQPNPADSSY
jgi:type II secretory pathway predicted ATPase ExeA